MNILIIPGNPGVPSFYETYARELHRELDGNANIEILGYLGHSTDDLGVRGWFSLARQLDHVEAHLASPECFLADRGPVHVVGHSIGAEMALHAMHRLPNVSRVVGLMPFVLTNARSKTQKFLESLVRIGALVRAVAALVGLVSKLPAAIRDAMFHPVTKTMDPGPRALTRRWLRANSIVNMALMGRTEFDALAPGPRATDGSNERRASQAGRVGLIYCEDDHWAPTWQMDAFAAEEGVGEMTAVELVSSPEVEHAFVLSDRAAALIAKRTARMLA